MTNLTEAHTVIAMQVPMTNSGNPTLETGATATKQCRILGKSTPGCALLKMLLAFLVLKTRTKSCDRDAVFISVQSTTDMTDTTRNTRFSSKRLGRNRDPAAGSCPFLLRKFPAKIC